MKPDMLMPWTSGKDSALALARLKEEGAEIASLITVVGEDDAVSVHGVPRSLLRAQAKAIGLPLDEIDQGEGERYEDVVSKSLRRWSEKGISRIAFGDLFLSDIREWRDRFHQEFGMECVYPIWWCDTHKLAREFISKGFRAVVVCVDTKRLGLEFAGREYDEAFLAELPVGVDPGGENGEFHTFVYDGPIFSEPVAFTRLPVEMRKFESPGHLFEFGFCPLKGVEDEG